MTNTITNEALRILAEREHEIRDEMLDGTHWFLRVYELAVLHTDRSRAACV